jgi:hypothetical protein
MENLDDVFGTTPPRIISSQFDSISTVFGAATQDKAQVAMDSRNEVGKTPDYFRSIDPDNVEAVGSASLYPSCIHLLSQARRKA